MHWLSGVLLIVTVVLLNIHACSLRESRDKWREQTHGALGHLERCVDDSLRVTMEARLHMKDTLAVLRTCDCSLNVRHMCSTRALSPGLCEQITDILDAELVKQ